MLEGNTKKIKMNTITTEEVTNVWSTLKKLTQFTSPITTASMTTTSTTTTTTTTTTSPLPTSEKPPLYGTGFITMVSLIVCMVPLGCLLLCCARAFVRSRWKKRRIAAEKIENQKKDAKRKSKEDKRKTKQSPKQQTFVSDQV